MELKKKNRTNPNQKSTMKMKMMMRVERFVIKLCFTYVFLGVTGIREPDRQIFDFELQEDDDE